MLLAPSLLLKEGEKNDTNVMLTLRILREGMLSTVEVEKDQGDSSIRKSTGTILNACQELVSTFLCIYEKSGREESAFIFKNRWWSSDEKNLEKNFS